MNKPRKPWSRKGGPRKRGRGKKSDRRHTRGREAGGQIEDNTPAGPTEGVLDIQPDGIGFLRSAKNGFIESPTDVFVPKRMIQEHHLRPGCLLAGHAANNKGRRALTTLETVEGKPPEEFRDRPHFTQLTSINPCESLDIAASNDISMRILDLVAPIGKGQRGLIVAPPRTGKTVLLQLLANSIAASHPEVELFMLLVDERPEEVTEMKRTVKAEVIHSSNDHPPQRHIKIVEMVLERARRLAEGGVDVVILLDSLTRVARAYNTQTKGSGRTLSGGLDSRTMLKPREFFGAARKIEEGGSITIIATALIDTGSRMDEVIFEEFKGTGNMELYLHRGLADRRIWPAINIHLSGTRREEKLRPAEVQQKVNMLRRVLADRSPEEALQLLLSRLEKTASNEQFYALMR